MEANGWTTAEPKPDLRNASNPRALSEAEAAFFGSIATDLGNGEAVFVPGTGQRTALVRSKDGVLGIVDLLDGPAKPATTPTATKKAKGEPVKLDPSSAAHFPMLKAMKPGETRTLPGGALLTRDARGDAWMTA